MEIGPFAEAILSGQRRALSRAITLVESTRADHRAQAAALLDRVRQSERQALRIALSGTPGVGKSTFIESFGMMLLEQGLKVAVLAVDPSSKRTGGSILGDKTRMETLARAPNAFIRPSPAGAQLGGLARNTRESVLLVEAAGFDVVLIETVGVGQSETVAAELSDLFVLLIAPAGGDELQGVKRGIMEMADLILVNKADGDLQAAAARTCADYAGALRLMRRREGDPDGFPKAMRVSALTNGGLELAWQEMTTLANWRKEQGHFKARRIAQARYWFHEELRAALLAVLQTPQAQASIEKLQAEVSQGRLDPSQAAAQIIAQITKSG